MAGEMINTHRQILAGKVARDPSFAELYMAHFLGVNGASRFVALLSDQPGKSASKAFPRAAKANRSLFFASKKEAAARTKALTVAEVQGRIGRDDRQTGGPVCQRARRAWIRCGGQAGATPFVADPRFESEDLYY